MSDNRGLTIRIADREGNFPEEPMRLLSEEKILRDLFTQSTQGAVDSGKWEIYDAYNDRVWSLDAELPESGRLDLYARQIRLPRIWAGSPGFKDLSGKFYVILDHPRGFDILSHMCDSGYSAADAYPPLKPGELTTAVDRIRGRYESGECQSKDGDIVVVGSCQDESFREAQGLAKKQGYLRFVNLDQYATNASKEDICYAFLTDLLHEEALAYEKTRSNDKSL